MIIAIIPNNIIPPPIPRTADIDEVIKINEIEIGKIINNSNFPFGLFKFKDPNFRLEEILTTRKAKIKVKKPFWA